MTPAKSLAEAEQSRAAEEAKQPQADAAKRKISQLEQENHLAYLFRRAFTGY